MNKTDSIDILLSVTGMTPQVVTETLYAIHKETPERFPKEIYIITTKKGAEGVRNNLLGEKGKLNEFCREYGISPIVFNEDRHLKIIHDVDGELIDDARTKEEQAVIADFIFNEIKELTELNQNNTPKYRIHASIAGGRKTMTYLTGSSMNILANPQDRLSHVLVSEAFESNKEFYYPTKSENLIPGKQEGIYLDTSKAKVELSEIPLMRLRTLLDNKNSSLLTGYTHAVNEINKRLMINPKYLELTVDPGTFTLTISEKKSVILNNNQISVVLEPREFAVFMFIIEKIKNGEGFTIPSSKYKYESFIDAVKSFFELFSKIPVKDEMFQKRITETRDSELYELIKAINSKISEYAEECNITDPVIPPYSENTNWLYTLADNANIVLKRSGKKDFIILNGDPYDSGRNHNLIHPVKIESFELNKDFLTSQKDFWQNTIKNINKKIQKELPSTDLAVFYTITCPNKVYRLGIPPENIHIRNHLD
ncbi:CRISPR-associated ring nuclease Csm6 [uncultured Ruminobacter sp.]|uniref:CRISPR-associated ring nuclease Csm6 n=1 Tax=uncultured Ruminobacter sp. TaxID=538947 RepID=UPI0026066DCC|nr:CRISPR-associated ring nuclease Csm6 [uncultured Ruminobacter sp.]